MILQDTQGFHIGWIEINHMTFISVKAIALSEVQKCSLKTEERYDHIYQNFFGMDSDKLTP